MKSYEKLLSFLRNHPFHHMLCGVFFVILGVNELQGKVEWSELLICLFAVATLVAIFFTCVKVLSKRKIHSAIFTTIFLLLVLFYAHVFFFLISISVIKFFLKEGYFIILVTLTVTGLAIYLLKTRRQLTKLNLYFNVLMIAYLVVEFTGILRHIDNVGSPSVSNISPSNTVKDFTHTPDIYFIIADAYAREDNLKKYWNYDNHVFIETLQKRGFYYVKHSKSNYDNTLSSIASTLNMEYLPKQLDINTNRNPIDTQNQLLEKIQHNKVFHKLQSEGYAIHNLSLFTILNFKQHYFDRFFYRSFYNHLLSKTLPMRVYARYTTWITTPC